MTRNPLIRRGINKYGRSLSRIHRFSYLHKNKGFPKKPAKDAAPKGAAPGKKEAKKQTHRKPSPRFTEAGYGVRHPMRSRKNPKPAKLRTSITPGTVLILLAGRFRGKRVVFLKQLPSGLLLVTGPRQLNGVPLRRVNQAYVIATSTKVDVSKANVKDINDEFFARAVEKKKKGDNADSFFKAEEKKKELPKERVEKQKAVDAPLLAEIKSKKQTLLPQYLKARFSLSNATPAHLLKF